MTLLRPILLRLIDPVPEIDRKRTNLTKRIALIDDDEVAAPLLAEIAALDKHKLPLEAERVKILEQQAAGKKHRTG